LNSSSTSAPAARATIAPEAQPIVERYVTATGGRAALDAEHSLRVKGRLNTIELRGQSFLWLPDLSRPDPLFIIPIVMGLSMFGLSKMGQRGIPPNPQMKMMVYMMPVMMTVFFFNLASGLNLYYAVSNLASIPQQWLISEERMKLSALREGSPKK